MTVVEDDRIELAMSENEVPLDKLFEWLEIAPEGHKSEVVGGVVFMVPQRDTHWDITRLIIRALEDRFGRDVRVKSDVRIDFPGDRNAFCPDVAKIRDDAEKNDKGRWNYEDVEFVAEVISKGTGMNDYGPKKVAYATAGVPVYVIVDPYTGRCIAHTKPEDGEYTEEMRVPFGTDLDLTKTPLDFVLRTEGFPRD
ncbi:Uma2 family endonuclease [Streptomyces sp. NPDC012637]|uniref:Uma2 family endonuclease n=1 Tax=Streptomyces sp. NPDC012637 TaxID=3364842 RepID=UPI0036EFDAC7